MTYPPANYPPLPPALPHPVSFYGYDHPYLDSNLIFGPVHPIYYQQQFPSPQYMRSKPILSPTMQVPDMLSFKLPNEDDVGNAIPNRANISSEESEATPNKELFSSPEYLQYQPFLSMQVPDMLDVKLQNENDDRNAIPNKEKITSEESVAVPNKDGSQDHDDDDIGVVIPNKNVAAIPNKVAILEPEPPLPFPVGKSKLPLSILQPEDCHSEEGLVGECMSPYDCGLTDGIPSGLCHMGLDVSLHARVCCTYPANCGYETNKRVTYLKSPAYPKPTTSVSGCPFKIDLLPGVCQVRLDFLDLKMRPTTRDGYCDPKNKLLIKSSHSSTLIPMSELCGTVSVDVEDPLRTDIPHLYIHFDESIFDDKDKNKMPNKEVDPWLELHFNVKGFPSSWNIRVNQINCDGANLQAPTGCSQFYNQKSGNITSFNLVDGRYMVNSHLDMCIERDPAACAIKYNLKKMSIGGHSKGGGLGYGLVCDDFLKMKGEKTGICGKSNNREMILPVKGSVGLAFRADDNHLKGDVGYQIEYQYLHECENVEFFKYPSLHKT